MCAHTSTVHSKLPSVVLGGSTLVSMRHTNGISSVAARLSTQATIMRNVIQVNAYEVMVSDLILGQHYMDSQHYGSGNYTYAVVEVVAGLTKVVVYDLNGGVYGWCMQTAQGEALADFARLVGDDSAFFHGANGYYVEFSETDLTCLVPTRIIYRTDH